MGGIAADTDVFRAVADPTRRALIGLLHESDRSVVELADPFRMTRPAISQHLRILRDAGLVRVRRAGRKSLYRLNPRPLHELHRWVAHYVEDPFGHVWSIRPRPKDK